MDTEFRFIDLSKLTNDEHFQLMMEFKNTTSTRQAHLHMKARALFTQTFLPALAVEDEGLKKIVRSVLTKQITAADKLRDETYAGMVSANNTALKHFDPAKREAAERLEVLFGTYGNINTKSLDAQTSAVYNFLQDLRGPAYAEDAGTVGLLEWAAFLEARNLAVNNLLRQRNDEETAKTNVVLREARIAVDAAYKQVTKAIEAFILLGDGDLEMVIQLVETFNGIIERFIRRMNKRRRRPAGANEDAEIDGDGQDDGDDAEEGGEGQGEE